MKPKKTKAMKLTPFNISAALALVFALPWQANAGNVTWSGTGSDTNWSTANNWSAQTAPLTNDNFSFAGSTATTNINDITGLTLGTVTIDASAAAWNISGNAVTLGGNLTVTGTKGVTWGLDTTIAAGTQRNIRVDTSGTLIITGHLLGAGTIYAGNYGTTALNATNNDFTGTIRVGYGNLLINNMGALGTGTVSFNYGNNWSYIKFGVDGNFSNSINLVDGNAGVNNITSCIDTVGHNVTLSGTLFGLSDAAHLNYTYLRNSSSTSSTLSITTDNSGIGAGTVFRFNSVGNLTVNYGNLTALGGAHTIEFNGGNGTLQAGVDGTLGGTSGGAKTINVVSGLTATIDTNSHNTWLSGSINAGAGTFTKTGAGTLTLNTTGTSNFKNINSNGGTLNISSALTGSNNTLAISTNGGDVNISGNIVAANGLTKTNANTLTLSGSNAYTGTTTLGGGLLVNANASALGASTALVFTGGTMQYGTGVTTDVSSLVKNSTSAMAIDTNGQNVTYTNTLASTNTGGLTKLGAGTLILTASNAYAGTTTVSGGTLQLGNGNAGGALASTSAISVASGANFTVNRSDAATQGKDFGTLIGAGSFTQAGSGTTTLSSANSYSGTTTLGGGLLVNANASALGASTALTFAGGTMQYGTGVTTDVSSILKNSTSAMVIDTNGQNVTYTNSLASTNTGGLTKLGTGVLILSASNAYAGATTISGGTLQLGNGSTTGALSTLSAISIGSGANLAINRSNTVTQGTDFSGAAITGAGSFTQAGSGTTVLTTANSYSGGTVLKAGGIKLMDLGALGSGAISVTGNSTLSTDLNGTFANDISIASGQTLSLIGTPDNQALTFSGTLSGAGAVKVTTSLTGGKNGSFTINNANSLFSGTLLLNAGSVILSNTGALGAGSVSFDTGAQWSRLVFGVSGTFSNAIKLSGNNTSGGVPAWLDAKGNNVTLSGTLSGSTDAAHANRIYFGNSINSGTFTITNDNSGIGVGTAIWLNNSASGLTVNYGNLTALGGANTIRFNTDYVTLQAGVDGILGGAASGSSKLITVDNYVTARIDTNSHNVWLTGTLNAGGNSSSINKLGAGTLTLSGVTTGTFLNATVTAGTLQLGDGGATGALLSSTATISSGGNLTINRNNTASQGTDFGLLIGAGSFTQAGSGNTILNANNTYSGKTTVASGTLSFNNTNATATGTQSLGTNTAVDLGVAGVSSAVLNYTGAAGTFAKTINALGNGLNTVRNTGSGLLTLSGSLVKNGTILVLDGGANGLLVSGTISGSSANSDLYVTGGTTTLTAQNTYSGPTKVYGGGVLVNGNASGALPTATTLVLGGTDNSAGTFDLNGNAQTVAELSSAGNNTANLVTNNGGSDATLTVNGSGQMNYSGVIADGSAKTALTVNSGDLELAGVNTYTGATLVSSGTLGVNGSLGNTAVTVQNGGVLSGSGSVAGSVTVNSGKVNGNGLSMGNTKLTGSSSLAGVSSATSYTVANGTTSLTGTAKGTVAISTGATLDQQNGLIKGNTAVSGLLKGFGTIDGSLSLTSGTLSPSNGSGRGIMAITGDFTMLDNTSTLALGVSGTLAGVDFDQVVVSGAITLKGVLNLTSLSGLAMGDKISLILNTSNTELAVDGTFSTIEVNGIAQSVFNNTFTYGGQEYQISYNVSGDASGVANDVVLTAVPETSTWAMILGGMGVLAGYQKMRRRRLC